MAQFEALVGVNFWTALFVLLNTLAIYFVAKKYLTDPVMKIIAQRQKEIDDTNGEAEAARSEALSMREECENRLAGARDEASEIVRTATTRATARTEEMMMTARAEVVAMKTKADAEIASERRKAAGELKNDISEMVLDIAQLVVEKEIDPSAHKELIDGFIDHMGDAT